MHSFIFLVNYGEFVYLTKYYISIPTYVHINILCYDYFRVKKHECPHYITNRIRDVITNTLHTLVFLNWKIFLEDQIVGFSPKLKAQYVHVQM